MSRTPNHICKNPRCSKGSDGGPMHYWTCNDCDKRNSWKAAACDEECYEQYLEVITVARGSKIAEADSAQLSMFDESVLAADTEVQEADEIVSTAPVHEKTLFQNYSKKNKHYR